MSSYGVLGLPFENALNSLGSVVIFGFSQGVVALLQKVRVFDRVVFEGRLVIGILLVISKALDEITWV